MDQAQSEANRSAAVYNARFLGIPYQFDLDRFCRFPASLRRLKLGCKSRQSRDHLLCGGHYLDGLVWQCALTYLLVRSPCFSQRPNEPMSVAFTKEEDNEAAAAYLPE